VVILQFSGALQSAGTTGPPELQVIVTGEHLTTSTLYHHSEVDNGILMLRTKNRIVVMDKKLGF
jgi:hypothetical protein